jgi:hypothetical protein
VGAHAAASRGLSAPAAVLLAVGLLLLSSCARPAPQPSVDPNTDVIVRYAAAGNGQLVFTVRPYYTAGAPVTIDLDITAGSMAIRGPLSGRVILSGLEGERLIHLFSAAELAGGEVAPGTSRRLQIVWDATDADGKAAPAETYGLTLDFIVGDETKRFGTVFDVRVP